MVIGERGLMGLGDCGAPSDSRVARSTIVRYHPPVLQKSNTTKVELLQKSNIDKYAFYNVFYAMLYLQHYVFVYL